jgi:hypothetical protein
MGSVLGKIMVALAWKILSEKVVSEVFVNLGWALVSSTENNLDDKIMRSCAEALGVKVEDEVKQ